MIIYDLICHKGHTFEGWFPNWEEFQTQRGAGFVECPVCGDSHVRQVPSGGHIGGTKAPAQLPTEMAKSVQSKSTESEMAAVGQLDPVTLVKAVRHYVKTHFENVGKDFATRAIQMHKGETPVKNIYGEADKKELKELAQEDVPHFLLPNLPPEYDN